MMEVDTTIKNAKAIDKEIEKMDFHNETKEKFNNSDQNGD
jgi:hypothetical protein